MKLTGKALVDFWQWYFRQQFLAASLSEYSLEEIKKHFLALADSFKWGVFVDFFDSVNLKISVEWLDNDYSATIQAYEPIVEENLFWIIKHESQHETLHDARIEAIVKANEIYNTSL